MNQNFWHGKRVLLTGHTGFKGSWLSLWLQRLGTELIGYSLEPPTEPNLFTLSSVSNGMTSILGDVRDLDHLSRVISEQQPEIVIHMAAQALVRSSYKQPVETYATNVMGTVNLLEAVRQSDRVRVALIVTSDKCYENQEWVWGYRENDPMGGYDPYSSSKGCAELVTAAYRNSFFHPASYEQHGVAIASARAGNVIGGGDWAKDRLVPDILRAAIAKEPIIIRNPKATRPWQHVLEPLSGYLTLAERLYQDGPRFVGGWNFAPNDEAVRSVEWVVEQLLMRWADHAGWQQDQASQPHEAHLLKLDCTKAKSYLGWHPTLDLSTALDWIVEWTKMWHQARNIRQITEKQILNYMTRLTKETN